MYIAHFDWKKWGQFRVFTTSWVSLSLFHQYSFPVIRNDKIFFFFFFLKGLMLANSPKKVKSLVRSDQISRSVVSDSLWPHELQHARPPCPSPTPGVHSDSCPSSQWCHPAISSSVVPFSSCPQSLPASESFPMSQLFAWGGLVGWCNYLTWSKYGKLDNKYQLPSKAHQWSQLRKPYIYHFP